MQMQRELADRQLLVERCLAAFIAAGTIDLSLDQLSDSVGVSKRMLIHYFGGRESLEERAIGLLEDRLRARFAPESFPPDVSPAAVVAALWKRTTTPEARGVLLLLMDLSRRAWKGSARARAFYAEQQRLWVQLLVRYVPDQRALETLLQTFQGAVLAYLITGDPEPGRRSLARLVTGSHPSRPRRRPTTASGRKCRKR